jgi:broad specificity phosphatase PhoE
MSRREAGRVSSILLVRHAEPRTIEDETAAQWPLTDMGRKHASMLGRHLSSRFAITLVWTSPERRACETAALAFPSVVPDVRHQLSEVKKPWYASSEEHMDAIANYLEGVVVEGWERREDVIDRVRQLTVEFRTSESLVLVTHGVLLTTWLDHEVGLGNPFSFWTNLQLPDAWHFDPDEKSLERVASRI